MYIYIYIHIHMSDATWLVCGMLSTSQNVLFGGTDDRISKSRVELLHFIQSSCQHTIA